MEKTRTDKTVENLYSPTVREETFDKIEESLLCKACENKGISCPFPTIGRKVLFCDFKTPRRSRSIA